MSLARFSLCSLLAISLCCLVSLPLLAQENDWPTFRGADRTGVAPDTGLMKAWPADGPKLVWETDGAGRGYATVAIAGDQLYTLGDGTADGDADEYLLCYERATGKQVWKAKTGPPFNEGQASWQSSRSTPTVDGDRVYVITPQGVLFCVGTVDGAEKWKVNLKKEYGGKKAEMWGYSESVLIDGDNLICTPGGPKNTMIALDKNTGEKVWSTPRDGDRGAGHASIVSSHIGSTQVYVQTTGSGAMGVRASDGKLLWTYDVDKTTAIAPTPIVRDDLVFFSAGYGRGGALLRQVANGDQVDVEEIYPLNPKLTNKHGGIVLVGDHLYGDTDDRGNPFCAELMTGDIKWKSRGSGKKSASIAAADGHVYIRYSNGVMTLVKADPDSFQEVGSFKVPGSGERPSWAHPVIIDGRLYLREGDKILCYSIVDDGSVAVPAPAAKSTTTVSTDSAGEMLANGDFSNGMDGWQVDNGDDIAAKVEVVKEGPTGEAGETSIKIEVLDAPDEAWEVQMYQGDLQIEEGKSYVLNFWVKSNREGAIKINCMQNHDPWEHSTETEIYPSPKWEQQKFVFEGPWNDANGRITFADLGYDDGVIYWFSSCSLKEREAK